MHRYIAAVKQYKDTHDFVTTTLIHSGTLGLLIPEQSSLFGL